MPTLSVIISIQLSNTIVVLDGCSTFRPFAALHRCYFVIRETDMPAVVAIDKLTVFKSVIGIPGRQTHVTDLEGTQPDSVAPGTGPNAHLS